jgi:hypothetical protein
VSHLRVACALRVLEEREVHELCFWGSSCWRFGWGWGSCWEGELSISGFGRAFVDCRGWYSCLGRYSSWARCGFAFLKVVVRSGGC